MNAFKAMFVLVATGNEMPLLQSVDCGFTGENYADVVQNVLPLSDWYFIFFFLCTLIGLFCLGSLLIATFQTQYELQQARTQLLHSNIFLICVVDRWKLSY